MERRIPQRELRDNVAGVLGAAEAGESFTITVCGRPVARLVPPGGTEAPRVDVDRATIERILALRVDGTDLAAELDAAEAPVSPGT